MKKLLIVILLLQGVFVSCQTDFNREVWLKNNDLTDTNNPRSKMTRDLLNNYLKKGLTKNDVIQLLGTPLSDTIGSFLPETLKLPDTLSVNYALKKTEYEKKEIEAIRNTWYQQNYKSAPMITYSAGWDLVDPVLLEIILDENDIVIDFWLNQY